MKGFLTAFKKLATTNEQNNNNNNNNSKSIQPVETTNNNTNTTTTASTTISTSNNNNIDNNNNNESKFSIPSLLSPSNNSQKLSTQSSPVINNTDSTASSSVIEETDSIKRSRRSGKLIVDSLTNISSLLFDHSKFISQEVNYLTSTFDNFNSNKDLEFEISKAELTLKTILNDLTNTAATTDSTLASCNEIRK